MHQVTYAKLQDIPALDLLPILNCERVRRHLIEHEIFTPHNVKLWKEEKILVDSMPQCRVRAVLCHNDLAGWCGIQAEDNGEYEIAIVLHPAFWGLGKPIFTDLLGWAREMGHQEIYIQLLNSRRTYRFLQHMAKSVSQSHWQGHHFTRYKLVL